MLDISDIPFGNGSIQLPVWMAMSEYIRDHGVKTVLEFGMGLSTELFLMTEQIQRLQSWETNINWIEHMGERPKLVSVHYDYDAFEPYGPTDRFDMSFVDGPAHGVSADGRAKCMAMASYCSNAVFVHDAGRQGELQALNAVFDREDWELTEFPNSLVLMEKKWKSRTR